MKSLEGRTVLGFAAVVLAVGPGAAQGQSVRPEDVNARPLKLFFSPQRGDNFTAASDDGERSALASGYRFVRAEGYVLSAQAPGSVPLKLFYSDARRDNFTTATSEGERAALAHGYRFIRVEGYVYPVPQPGTVPLKLFWGAERNDNFSSATPEGERDALSSRYTEVRIEGYVLKSAIGDQAGCGLGVRWEETESGWTGIWTRRGDSDTFDATWTHPSAQPTTALLKVGIAGSNVNVERTQPDGTCSYGGTLGGDGVTVTGTYTCSWAPGRYDFRAAIRCGGDPRPVTGACTLALNKPARQSSTSQWSHANDAQGAVDGVKDGGFGFHTNEEQNPWWEVDLQAAYALSAVRIYNRLAYGSRARTLRVLLSDDGANWRVGYTHDGSVFGGNDGRPLIANLNGQSARYLRLQLAEKNWLHLDEVEVCGAGQPAVGNACDLECDRQCKAQGRPGGRFSGGICLLGIPSGGGCLCQ